MGKSRLQNCIFCSLSSVLVTFILSLFPLHAFAQSKYNNDIFKVFFEHDYEHNTLGAYRTEEWQADWNYPQGADRVIIPGIIDGQTNINESRFMRWYFPEGSVGPAEGGGQWYTMIPDGNKELYFSYNLRFKPGFDWVGGGKVPGIRGGEWHSLTEPPAWDDGFMVLLMWKNPGQLAFYYYHHDLNHDYGDLEVFDHPIESGKWYNVTIRVVLNTVDGDGGNNDGILEGYIDGKMVAQLSNVRFRNIESISINRLHITSFFGGLGDSYAATKDEWIDMDDVVVYTYQPGINISRGNQVNPANIQLPLPYNTITSAMWIESLHAIPLLTNQMLLTWIDNPSAGPYTLQRRKEGESEFSTITELNYGVKSYTDNGLQAETKYYYRIICNGVTSNISSATTLASDLPEAPSSLKSKAYSDKSITLSWQDNSDDEESFIVQRQSATKPDEIFTFSVNPDDTMYTDNGLTPNTTYIYTVQAVNNSGVSAQSNKNIASTISMAEAKRIKEGLVAYYNFNFDPESTIRDFSNYEEPLNLLMSNPAAFNWVESKGISILSNSTILSGTSAKKVVQSIKRSNELTVECWIRPDVAEFSSVSRIISLGSDNSNAGFVLDQDYMVTNNDRSIQYKVRMKTESTNQAGYPEITPERNSNYINLQHIVYVIDSLGKEILYINGEKAAEGFRPGNLNNWNDSYFLRLGNDEDRNHGWKGTFYTLAIYNAALSYDQLRTNYESGPCDNLQKDGMEYRMNLYPNPVRNSATVEIIPEAIHDMVPPTDIRLYDIYGNLHLRIPVFNPNQQYTETVDLSGFPEGIYYLQILSGTKQNTTKLVKY